MIGDKGQGTRDKGVTFVELLVTVALLAVVAGTFVGALVGGLEVWRRLHTHAAFDQQVLVALEVMRRDLRNAQPFRRIPFEGDYETLSFPTLLEVDVVGETVVREVGRSGYYLDTRHHRLCQVRRPYRTLRRGSFTEGCRSLADGVERLRFEYYVPDPSTGEPHWTGTWSDPALPLAVKVVVGYRLAPKTRLITRTLVVDLPTAGPPRET